MKTIWLSTFLLLFLSCASRTDTRNYSRASQAALAGTFGTDYMALEVQAKIKGRIAFTKSPLRYLDKNFLVVLKGPLPDQKMKSSAKVDHQYNFLIDTDFRAGQYTIGLIDERTSATVDSQQINISPTSDRLDILFNLK